MHQFTTISEIGVHLTCAFIFLPSDYMRGSIKHSRTLCVGKGIIPVHMCMCIPPFLAHWWGPTQKIPCKALHATPTYILQISHDAGG